MIFFINYVKVKGYNSGINGWNDNRVVWHIYFFLRGGLYIQGFYPFVTSSVAILLTLLTFALGFVTRPVGAYIFGHYGDRIGRKKKCFY